MKLYHGTNGAWLQNILAQGLRPRGTLKSRSNWNHSVRSNPRCVYLTDSYAAYFAFNAARGKEPLCAVIEIDTDLLDEENLFPDEDFLEQATRQGKTVIPGDMKARTLHYRKHQFDHDSSWMCVLSDGSKMSWWEASLQYLGTCSHRGVIPPSAITRAVTWPHKPNAWMMFLVDPSISLMNQKICGPRYKALTRKLFDGEFTSHAEARAQQQADPIRSMQDPPLPVIEGWNIIVNQKDRAALTA